MHTSNFMDKIRSDGYNTIFASSLATILSFYYSYFLGLSGLFVTLFCIWFFRDPERVIPKDSDIVLSPADGVVVNIDYETYPPDFDVDSSLTRVGIFLRLSDVHVNRLPISGKVEKIKYHEGKFDFAWRNETNENNERLSIKLAGFIARRIVCDIEENDNVSIGSTYGMIKFGSRVDTYFPSNMIVNVKKGQTVVAGETIIASFGSDNLEENKNELETSHE